MPLLLVFSSAIALRFQFKEHPLDSLCRGGSRHVTHIHPREIAATAATAVMRGRGVHTKSSAFLGHRKSKRSAEMQTKFSDVGHTSQTKT